MTAPTAFPSPAAANTAGARDAAVDGAVDAISARILSAVFCQEVPATISRMVSIILALRSGVIASAASQAAMN